MRPPRKVMRGRGLSARTDRRETLRVDVCVGPCSELIESGKYPAPAGERNAWKWGVGGGHGVGFEAGNAASAIVRNLREGFWTAPR